MDCVLELAAIIPTLDENRTIEMCLTSVGKVVLAVPETALACFHLHTEPDRGGGDSHLYRAWLRYRKVR